MPKDDMIKVLFALEMAKNRLKEDKVALESIKEARDLVFDALVEVQNNGSRS